MKQIYYALWNILKAKTNSLIKIVSLTLGLVVALVLFSKVSFEMSYDKFYPDADRIFRLQRVIYNGETSAYDGPIIVGPITGALKNDLAEVEDGVVLSRAPSRPEIVIYDQKKYSCRFQIGEPSFFDVLGVRILQGDKRKLDVRSQVFLSQSFARKIFGDEDPLDKELLPKGGESPYIVAGIYEDLPANSHLKIDMLVARGFDLSGMSWLARDSFMGYVKLKPGVKAEDIEAKIPDILRKHFDVDAEKARGNDIHYFLHPITELHSGDQTVKRMLLVLSILAFSLLFISAMNYLLISISSLMVRAKAIGVHKCNGASDGNIFMMFFYETVGILLVALGIAVLCIFVFRGSVEEIIQTSLAHIFSADNLWVSLLVIVALLLCTGIIPAVIFSRVPVTSIFRILSVHKAKWKKSLLFAQFASIAFICFLLFVIVRQYDLLMNKNLGYSMENVLVTEELRGMKGDQYAVLKNELAKMPQIQSVSVATNIPLDFMNGDMIMIPEKEEQFSTRFMAADRDYLQTFGIELVQGRNFSEEGYNSTAILVNETFLERMGWQESPIGRRIRTFRGEEPREIIGVMKNYQLMALFKQEAEMLKDIPPLIIYPLTPDEQVWWMNNQLIVKAHTIDASLLALLNERLQGIANDSDATWVSYADRMEVSYINARQFRKAVVLAAVIMLFITFIGLYGFTEDEITQRSKEIAIRKIIGAEAKDVLSLILKGIIVLALPALVIGFTLSTLVGLEWLQQFAVKIPMSAWMYLGCGLLILSGIALCITSRTWHVANENPVKHLRTE